MLCNYGVVCAIRKLALEISTGPIHFFHYRSQDELVLSRLKKMKQRQLKRTQAQSAGLLQRLRAIARNARLDWIKGKVRWFIENEEMSRIRANVEVEKVLGRSDKGLWTDQAERASVYRMDFMKEESEGRKFTKYHKESMEHWKHMIDPMLAEEKQRYQSIEEVPGGKDDVLQITDCQEADRPERRIRRISSTARLRLLESKRDRELVSAAEDVVQEIALICQKDFTPDEAMLGGGRESLVGAD